MFCLPFIYKSQNKSNIAALYIQKMATVCDGSNGWHWNAYSIALKYGATLIAILEYRGKAVARGGCHRCMCTPLFKKKNISFVE